MEAIYGLLCKVSIMHCLRRAICRPSNLNPCFAHSIQIRGCAYHMHVASYQLRTLLLLCAMSYDPGQMVVSGLLAVTGPALLRR